MAVTIEKDGPVTTVILSRAHARNAVDPATAAELVAAASALSTKLLCRDMRLGSRGLPTAIRYCGVVAASAVRMSRQAAPRAERSNETDFTIAKTGVPTRRESRSAE